MKNFAQRLHVVHVRIPELGRLLVARVLPGDALRVSEYGSRDGLCREDAQKTRRGALISSGVLAMAVILVGIRYFTHVALFSIKEDTVMIARLAVGGQKFTRAGRLRVRLWGWVPRAGC